MNTTLESLGGNLVRLTVTIPAADVDKTIAETYVGVAKQVRVPGFRKGRAPRPVVDTYVGREKVLADAREALIESSYPEAVDAEDMRPIDQPDLGELSEVVEGEDYTYVAEVQVRPELTLAKGWDKLAITAPAKEASMLEVDAQVATMAERFSSLEPVEDGAVESGDFVLLSFVGLVDGVSYEGNIVDKYLYEMGRGQMPQEFDDALLGAKPGDVREADFEIPATSVNPEFVGKIATFEITVHEIKRKQLPVMDDEFAANAGGVETMVELRADLKKRLDDSRAYEHARTTERNARVELAKLLEGEVPEVMVAERRDSMVREFFNNLEHEGISLKDYVNASGVDPEQIQKDIEVEARERVRQDLALEALFRLQDMEVTDADIDQEVAEFASSSDKTPEELRKQWEEAGITAVLHESVVQRKAVGWLLEHVKVEIESPEGAAADAEKSTKTSKPKKPRASATKKKE